MVANRSGVMAPDRRASTSAGTGTASISSPGLPSHGAMSASSSACGTGRTALIPGMPCNTATLAAACAARASGRGSRICTVIPPESCDEAALAALRRPRPPAVAITVNVTIIATTEGIGPSRPPLGRISARLPPRDLGGRAPRRDNRAGNCADAAGASGRSGASGKVSASAQSVPPT